MSRIRANQITNQSADGAPTVQNGLVISGVTTSTTFSGSGASLTNLNASNIASGTVPTARLGSGTASSSTFLAGDSTYKTVTGTTINTSADNRVLTGTGTANTIQGESGLLFDGQELQITNAQPKLKLIDTGVSNVEARVDGDGGNLIIAADHNNAVADTTMTFTIDQSEKLRIDSSGRLLLGTTTEGTGSGDNLTVAASGNMGLTLRSTSSNYCNIYFSDATSGTAEYEGYMSYNHATDSLEFATGHTERLRINSSGTLGVNLTTPKTTKGIHISKGAGNGGIGNSYSLANEYLHFGYSEHNSSGNLGLFTMGFGYVAGGTPATNSPAYLGYRETSTSGYTNGDLVFATRSATSDSAPSERLRISSTGQVTKPSQASFAAVNTSNGYSLNGAVFPFNSTTHNIGSHFNTSNYRFTAPVAGRYLFTFYSIYNSSGQGRYEILINGAADQNGTRVHMNNHDSNWDNTSTCWILNLAANDYIQMYSQTNTGWHGNHWQRFCGELLS